MTCSPDVFTKYKFRIFDSSIVKSTSVNKKKFLFCGKRPLCIFSTTYVCTLSSMINKYVHRIQPGLLYRWTELLADFLFLNSYWGREKGPPNYTPGVYFLDLKLQILASYNNLRIGQDSEFAKF